MTLRDWKAYTTASLDFPAPEPNKNIVLIGAPNGYGKTSLFEAIILGLFGRDGLPLIARSPFGGVGEEKLATSYRSFLEKALHRGASENGRNSCSIKLKFVDDDQEIELHRTWYFSDAGAYRPQDEQVHIYEGSLRKPVGPVGVQINDHLDWYRDYIARQFLPYYLAAFLFDGEQVSAFAEREMAAQVRTGIEGLLGIPVLRELADDLRSYARERRRGSKNVSVKSIERMEIDRDVLKHKLDQNETRLREVEPDLQRLKEEREKLTRELASFGAGSQAQLQEQLERLNGYRKEVELARGRLEDLLAKDVALALSGKILRHALVERLRSETIRERWETGKQQGDANLERFLTTMATGLEDIVPALSDQQRNDVLGKAGGSWEALWYSPPENCAATYRHPYLNELDRGKVIDKLDELEHLGAPQIVEILDAISANEGAAARLNDEIMRTEAIAPQIDTKRECTERVIG